MPNLLKQAPEAPVLGCVREAYGDSVNVTVRVFHVVVLALETPCGMVRLKQIRICHEEPSVHSK